ncbi:hypothetical protein Hanom_Chr09g00847111 [Helianthus anomalus]
MNGTVGTEGFLVAASDNMESAPANANLDPTSEVHFLQSSSLKGEKPGPTGNPAERMALRSGGNANPNSASALANSLSDNPGWTSIPEFFKWVKTLLDKDVKERRLLRGGSGVDGDDVAALAERRRRSARCAGFRPVVLLSTSTIFGGKKKRK